MKWHCDSNGFCHKECEAASIGPTSGETRAQYPIDCKIISHRTWIWADSDETVYKWCRCPVNNTYEAIKDKLISTIETETKYIHDSYLTNATDKKYTINEVKS